MLEIFRHERSDGQSSPQAREDLNGDLECERNKAQHKNKIFTWKLKSGKKPLGGRGGIHYNL